MPTLSSATLAATVLVAGYLCSLCTTSPNPDSDSRAERSSSDRAGILAGTFVTVWKNFLFFTWASHSLVTLFYPLPDTPRTNAICPNASNLSAEHFTWNSHVLTFLAMIFVGAFVRLSAYGGLGRNFTFHLANPDRLITDGIYRFMQHPSYSGAVLVTFGTAGLFARWDTVLGVCWLSPETLAWLDGSGWVFTMLWGISLFGIFSVRVRDEERMLHQQFGKEWEEWNARTARFIPGIW